MTMADTGKYCHICDKKHISKLSTIWCSECEKSFCTDCETVHSSKQSSASHVTIQIESYLALSDSIKKIRTHCSHHDQKYQVFCQNHEVPLCHLCMKKHSDCKDVFPLEKCIQNVKLSETVRDIEESLRDIEKNVSKIKACLQKNKQQLDQQKSDILTEIGQTRKKVNEHLDILEKRLNEEVSEFYAKATKELDFYLQSLHEKNAKALSHREQISILKEHGSNLQTFLVLRHLSANIDSSEKYLHIMIENNSFNKLSLECDINDKLSRLSSDIEKFGHMRLQRTTSDLTLHNHKERQAQHIVCKSKFSELVKSFDTPADQIRGCVVTSGGKILLTDYNDQGKCLNCIDSERNNLYKISTAPHNALDVTLINDTTVAVTSGQDKVISIIDISSRAVKKRIKVGYSCYGVSHRNGKLLVCAEDRGILSIGLKDEKIKVIVQCALPIYSYITSYKDKLYYTDSDTETVTCCDFEGQTQWTFRDNAVLHSPCGISTDDEGRVYVCDDSRDKVIELSNDGKKNKTIISKDDGLDTPFAVHFDKKRNNLLVANTGQKAFLIRVLS